MRIVRTSGKSLVVYSKDILFENAEITKREVESLISSIETKIEFLWH